MCLCKRKREVLSFFLSLKLKPQPHLLASEDQADLKTEGASNETSGKIQIGVEMVKI